MNKDNSKKDGMRESKRYLSVSTRLPQLDIIQFKRHCSQLNLSPSERIRDLILKDISKPSRQFLAGVNNFEYNRAIDKFSWVVNLDSGKKKEILSGISSNFLINIFNESEKALLERAEWVHQKKPSSVDIPRELIGGENGH